MKFIKYYQWVALSTELKVMEKLVYCALLSYQGKNKQCWPSQKTLSEVIGISPSAVYRAIKKLEKLNWIENKVFGHGKNNRYRCLMPNPLQIDYVSQPEGTPLLSEGQDPFSLKGNLSQPEGQPPSDRLSLVIEEKPTYQPTILLEGSGGREVGGFSVKKMIDEMCDGYVHQIPDKSTIKFIENTFTSYQVREMLDEVVDSWIDSYGTEKRIKSIPRVLAHRLKKAYGE